MGFEVEQLVLTNGRCPFKDWLAALTDKKTQLVVDARIARLRSGNLGDHKSVGEGVFELRIDYGPGLRVYFGRRGKEFIVLVGGGDKKTQNQDIRKAQELWRRYENGHR